MSAEVRAQMCATNQGDAQIAACVDADTCRNLTTDTPATVTKVTCCATNDCNDPFKQNLKFAQTLKKAFKAPRLVKQPKKLQGGLSCYGGLDNTNFGEDTYPFK